MKHSEKFPKSDEAHTFFFFLKTLKLPGLTLNLYHCFDIRPLNAEIQQMFGKINDKFGNIMSITIQKIPVTLVYCESANSSN